ncbi:MAG: YihY/virulence factor BrkB family protein [Fibrobacteria bacterium]
MKHSPFSAPKRPSPLKLGWTLIKDSATGWSDDKASRLAAALSYYTIFSIAPLLIMAIAIAGLAFGKEAASNQIFQQIRGLVGDTGALAIQAMVQGAWKSGGGIFATMVAAITLFIGASSVFGQLQDALNSIWHVEPKPGQGVKGFLRSRFLSFSMVLVIGFLLLVSLVLSAALAGVGHYLDSILPIPAVLLQALNFAVSFAVTSVLFTLIYKVLPDVTVKWKDVWIGGAVTALLFSLGRLGIGYYLGRGTVSSGYGAAGSLVVILIWIYYSSQILFFGAEFTKVYANTFGSHIKPSPNAKAVTSADRANQGLEPDAKSPHTAGHPVPEAHAAQSEPESVARADGRDQGDHGRKEVGQPMAAGKALRYPHNMQARIMRMLMKKALLMLPFGSIGYWLSRAYWKTRVRPSR